jgi:RNA polymerase sigma-70 factor, ECF subfamily
MAEDTLLSAGEDPESSMNLLRQAQAGQQQALNTLLHRYLPRLERWASGRIPQGARSMLETQDIVQEAVIKTLPRLDSMKILSDRTLEWYLKQAIRNRIIDLYRRPRRDREEVPADLAAKTPSAEDLVIGEEAIERYEGALDSLKERDRLLIVMHVELGLSNKEMAEELEMTPDAVRVALARALPRLAAGMKDAGE